MTKLCRDPFFVPWPVDIPKTFFSSLNKILDGFDDYDEESRAWKITNGFPKGDLFLEDGKAVVEFGLAGYSKDQLSVKVHDRTLSISASKCKKDDDSKESRTLARRSFTKEIVFNNSFDLQNAEVSYVDGLLRVVIPKLEPEVKTFELSIK